MNNKPNLADRIMRRVLIPLVLMLGLYGLLRYAVTGDSHLPAGVRPADTEAISETL